MKSCLLPLNDHQAIPSARTHYRTSGIRTGTTVLFFVPQVHEEFNSRGTVSGVVVVSVGEELSDFLTVH